MITDIEADAFKTKIRDLGTRCDKDAEWLSDFLANHTEELEEESFNKVKKVMYDLRELSTSTRRVVFKPSEIKLTRNPHRATLG